MCATVVGSPKVPQQNQQAVADLSGKGLTAAAELQRQAVKPETLKTRQTAIRELADWLLSKQDACNRSLQTAIPEDILVYFTQHWLPNHAGSMTDNGELMAALGSLASTRSHLSGEFELLGRCGDWDPATHTGNPMLSVQVRTMLKGYGNHAAQLGYQKRGALPLTEAEMQLLLQSMLNQCNSSSTDMHAQLLLLRDGMLFSLLWRSCFRGPTQEPLDWTTLQCQMVQVQCHSWCMHSCKLELLYICSQTPLETRNGVIARLPCPAMSCAFPPGFRRPSHTMLQQAGPSPTL